MWILGAFFGFTLLIGFGLIALMTRSSKEEKLIYARFSDFVLVTTSSHAIENSSSALLKKPATDGWMGRLDGVVDRSRFHPRLALLLQQAHSDSTPGKVIAASAACAVVVAVLARQFFASTPVLVFAGLPAASLPILKLRLQRSRYLRRFDAALPEGIDLMSRALKAGHSLASAIEVIAQQGTEPVAFEFGEVFRAQNFGLPFKDAILQLSARVPSKDLRFLVTAMLVQKETGGNLTEILDRTTHIIRERLRIQGEIRTKTAQGRLTGWILALMPIFLGVLINFINPGYAGPLLHDPLGRKMLWTGAALISIGSFIISKIVSIEV